MDRDPQTAKALYELVNQWPEGARPEGMYYSPAGNRYADFWYLGRQQNYPGACELPTAYAGLMFIASGLRWLMEHTTSFHTMRTAKGDIAIEHFGLDGTAEWITSRGPTLLLALHAAVLAAKENA